MGERVKTIQQVVDELDQYTDEERKRYIEPLTRMLSPLSHNTLFKFQNTWDGSRSFAEFKIAQNKKIRECVKIEIHMVGKTVREILRMKPLTMDMEVKADG